MAGSQLGEAVTAGTYPPLIAKRMSPVVNDMQRRFSAFVANVPTTPWDSLDFWFNRRLSRPPGGFVTDGGARPMGQSAWEQKAYRIKLMQAVGAVTGFAQAVTRATIGDLLRDEYTSTAEGLTWDLETAMGWGNAGATQFGPYPQFDGLDQLVNQTVGTNTQVQNVIEASGASLTLGYLDMQMDLTRTNTKRMISGANYMWVMPSTGITRVEQILQSQQRWTNESVQVNGGLTVSSYKGIPMIPSDFLGNAAGTMGTVAATSGTTGGSMAAGTYWYAVVPIMARAGMLAPAPAVSATTTGTTGVVNLSFTPPTGPQQAMPLSYQVYRGGSSTTTVLLGVVDAVAGLAADGITPILTTGITDTGATLVPSYNAGANIPAAYPLTYQGGSGAKLRPSGAGDIYLVPRNQPDVLIRPVVRDFTMLPLSATVNQPDQLPYALATDTVLAARAPEFMSRIRNISYSLAA